MDVVWTMAVLSAFLLQRDFLDLVLGFLLRVCMVSLHRVRGLLYWRGREEGGGGGGGGVMHKYQQG